MMDLSELMRQMRDYTGCSPCPQDFEQFWRERCEQAATPREVKILEQPFGNAVAQYSLLEFPGTDGAPLCARFLRPKLEKPVSVVLMFSDFDRPVRGWHHMTRFLALGLAVVALERRAAPIDLSAGWENAPEGLAMAGQYTDAVTTSFVAQTLPGIDPTRLITWGEGLGATMALVVAALRPDAAVKCAALNPLFADFRRVCDQNCDTGPCAGIRTHFRDQDPMHLEEDAFFEALGYLDCIHFAPLIKGDFLMGIGLMDQFSPPLAQSAVYNRVSASKRLLTYPKYCHERINAFENELLRFLY